MADVILTTDQNDDPVMHGEMPAFPPPFEVASLATGLGLTKREYFAAMAMQAILSNSDHGDFLHSHDIRAGLAVKSADALLKELAK